MNDQIYLIILRLLHICTGVFWAGSVIYLAAFIVPAVKALGPEGGKFMQQLAKTNKLALVMALAASLNVVCGILLLWKLSSGFQGAWMSSRHGMILSIGGGLAIIAYLEGLLVTRPTVDKLNLLGKNIAAAGAPPSAEQLQQLMTYRGKIFKANNFIAVILVIAVVFMSIAKYL